MNEKEIKRLQNESLEAWRFVMGSNQGRLVMREILQMSGLGMSPFNGATNQTIKNVGMQDVGRLIENRLKETSFESYLTMKKEEHEND